MKIITIDPGKSGAICEFEYELDENKRIKIYNFEIYRLNDKIDETCKTLKEIVDKNRNLLSNNEARIFLEKVHSMPHDGVSSSFNFGVSLGIIIGSLETLGVKCGFVYPGPWQKAIIDLLNLNREKLKMMKKFQKKKEMCYAISTLANKLGLDVSKLDIKTSDTLGMVFYVLKKEGWNYAGI
ncbi:MAG: hypothetical protein QW727_04120 [Candidatus Pacearchaeota archaeon]